jgi:peptide/nickel transport system ATP-binding protein
MVGPAPAELVERGVAGADRVVEVRDLVRDFDVSASWLHRALTGEPRRIVKAVDRVSFNIRRGETLALVGESGSGKSTIAKMVVGLLPPTAGGVRIDGVDIWDRANARRLQELRRRFGMIFQDPYASLNPRWRVRDIIAEPLEVFGITRGRRATAARVGELLTLVKLSPEDGEKYPHQFSGGQRQRIAIARALASEPEFLVCDEPTSALDVSVQAQILNLMKDLQDRLGLTYLFISHNLAVVRHMADRIAVLYLGRLAEIAPAKEMFRAPRHPYTRSLIDAIPDIDMTGRQRRAITGEIPNPLDPPPGCAFHPRCPFARDRCRAETPWAIDDGGVIVACHGIEEGWARPGAREPREAAAPG